MGKLRSVLGVEIDENSLSPEQRETLFSELRLKASAVVKSFVDHQSSVLFRNKPRVAVHVAARSFGHPGRSFISFAYTWEKKPYTHVRALSNYHTQDEATYIAVIEAIRAVSSHVSKVPILIRCSNKNVVLQAIGDYKVRSPSMKALSKELESLAKDLQVFYELVPQALVFEPLTMISTYAKAS
jgi:ribonuclease HI